MLDLTQTAQKCAGSYDRSVPLAETLRHEPLLRDRYGITRIGELTHLDRIGIPVFCAVVPAASDAVSVYAGKGITAAAARAGALMEAVERQAPSRSGRARLAYDLLNERAVQIERGDRSSNGLAGGNTLAEAVYHALCEVFERHVLSVAHAIAHERPRAIVARLTGSRGEIPGFIDDAIAMDFPVPTGSSAVDGLMTQIAAAGLTVHLRCVEVPPFPPLFVATIHDRESAIAPAHCGFGCSLSPEHAAVRALTEAAQIRLVDIQAAREDIGTLSEGPRRCAEPAGSWYFDAPARPGAFADLPDHSTRDLHADIAILLGVLRRAGCANALLVDHSPVGLPVAVVRLIVPGLESTASHDPAGSLLKTILDVSLPLDYAPVVAT